MGLHQGTLVGEGRKGNLLHREKRNNAKGERFIIKYKEMSITTNYQDDEMLEPTVLGIWIATREIPLIMGKREPPIPNFS